MSEAQVGGGRVEFELDGRPVALVPSLGACRAISSMAGGLVGARERCIRVDFETICAIIGEGIEIDGHRLNPRQRADMLPKAVYEAGSVAMAAHCINFITIIGRGGRPIEDLEDEDEDQDDGAGAGAEGPLDSAT